ncbi:MAG TPA: outer membrane protein assembly factor BamD [Pirellulaceae bacterium]|nr:outer membrane protein assembly factor BamD [Pirellulaceae bacterium]
MSEHRIMAAVITTLLALVADGCSQMRATDRAMEDYRRGITGSSSAIRGLGRAPENPVRTVSYDEDAEAVADPLTVEDFGPTELPNTFKRLVGKGPNRSEAEKAFGFAEDAYEEALTLAGVGDGNSGAREIPAAAREKFAVAGERYREAAERYPNSSLSHDALFQAGEAYFFADRYAESNESFEMLIKQFPGTRYLDRAEARRFSIARYWLQLDEIDPDSFLTYNLTDPRRPRRDTDGHAMRVLDKIRLDDPTGKLADDATMALGNAYFAHGRLLDAADTYEDLRQAYPGTPHLFNAMLLEIRARLDAYRGPDYDGTGLVRSDRLLQTIVKQFPGKVDENRQVLDELASEIRHGMAERDLAMAQLYERRKEYRAARIHYQLVLDKYPETSVAQAARDRMTAIADLPDVPPVLLPGLVALLPEPKDQKPLFPSRGPR